LSRLSLACTKFIAGEPMKPATKRFVGLANSSSGGATCWRSPFFITATSVPIVMASV
jgi:hypothetical protein